MVKYESLNHFGAAGFFQTEREDVDPDWPDADHHLPDGLQPGPHCQAGSSPDQPGGKTPQRRRQNQGRHLEQGLILLKNVQKIL